ncbi:hypothetical protein FRC01_010725 [Tulasnella sp. 417]|nr:hypothetical protein FRC01_010725 [Tulasnella sp. 417]
MAKDSKHVGDPPKLASKPTDLLSQLPTELLMIIARLYLHLFDGNHDITYILLLTQVNRRLRQVIVGTPDLWASFDIFDEEGYFHIARLCIERSRLFPLEILLRVGIPEAGSDFGDRCYDLLHPAASRIQVLRVVMFDETSFGIGQGVLAGLEMPALKEIELQYDSLSPGDALERIRIPRGCTNLQTLTVEGLFPTDYNSSNLKSLTLASAIYCRWSSALISNIIVGSPHLENLTFMGPDLVDNVADNLASYVLPCPSLRSLAMKGGIVPSFTAGFLLALRAPNLETVHVTGPHCHWYERTSGTPALWEEVIDRLEERYARSKETFGNVRSLTIEQQHERYRHEGFFRFLMTAFPRITSLNLDQRGIDVLSVCNVEDGRRGMGWVFLNKLTIHGCPPLHALERLLAFFQARGYKACNFVEGYGEERGDEGDDGEKGGGAEENHNKEVHDEDEDAGGGGDDEGAENEVQHRAGKVVAAGVREGKSKLGFMPIETLVIQGRRETETATDEVLGRLRDTVESLQIV